MIKLMSLVDRKHVAVFMNDSKQYKIDLATALNTSIVEDHRFTTMPLNNKRLSPNSFVHVDQNSVVYLSVGHDWKACPAKFGIKFKH